MSTHLSKLEILRREKLEELRSHLNPYPQAEFTVTAYSADLLQKYDPLEKDIVDTEKKQVQMAGRIMSVRDMGKAAFAVLQDGKGRIQIYIRKDDICPSAEDTFLYEQLWKKLIDIGDFVGVRGFVFKTKMGETTIHVESLTLLAKAVKPLPVVKEADGEVFDQVTDVEFKYRQRYAHLVIEPSVKDTFIKRTQIINQIRSFYNELGMLEVETPVLQPIPGGASARPFITHHNTLDMPLYLRIANELYLKRLIIGGFDAVYEFSRNFRNEGMDRTHNPEFTILEMYIAFKDYLWMMKNTEQLFERLALSIHGKTTIEWGEDTIDFKAPFVRLPFYEAIEKYTSLQLKGKSEEELRSIAKKMGIQDTADMHTAKLLDEIFSEKCELNLIQPTFITDYPLITSPLTKVHRNDKELVERFELFIGGKEIANAYSELNDPIEQRKRFEEQVQLLHKGDDEAMRIDFDFLRAMEYGMPPCSGIGIGIDRLVMLLVGQRSIQDVLFFPQMRLENTPS